MGFRAPRRTLLVIGLVGAVLTGCTAEPAPPLVSPSPQVSASVTPALSSPPTPTLTPTSPPTPARSPSPTPATTPSSPPAPPPKPVILIDPGHSGRSITSTDRATGLRDIDYPNYPEIDEVFAISRCAAQALRRDGYRVVLTKKQARDSVGLAARARMAAAENAVLAISVHDDHSQTADFEATYSQRGVKHAGRYHAMYRGSGANRTVFDRAGVARRSERAAAAIAKARSQAQGRPVSVRENIYTGRAPLEPGNLALVQLLSSVPWVYNEMGALTGGVTSRTMTMADQRGYAKGLVLGVEAAVPRSTGRVAQPSRGIGLVAGCLEGTR
ncbi:MULTISPECIES: N-acetylmuramoyl-L-alanine amidase [Actinomycetes]|uniref:N-acetylmuramoyl-L-alanine amidase n=1 Tax=Actinomycetes TaxID=1760 RepID=UPI0035C9DD52